MTNRTSDILSVTPQIDVRHYPLSSILYPLPPRPARRGSVMIMVVALLVLLAIMGTAYLATSRGDRITSIQSQANQQTEQNINAVINIIKQTLIDDLHGTNVSPDALRVAGPFDVADVPTRTEFENFDTPGRIRIPVMTGNKMTGTEVYDPDPWLADRLPEHLPGFRIPSEDSSETALNRYAWRWISAPIGGVKLTETTWQYDDPYAGPFEAPRDNIMPAIAPDGGPGLTWEANLSNPSYTAADTDGDGVADAFFSKLPGSTTNGLSTFVAVRTVDNAAAVNASVALEHWESKSGRNNDLPTNVFPVNIGLSNPISPTDSLPDPVSSLIGRSNGEWSRLQNYRLGINSFPSPTAPPDSYMELDKPVIENGTGQRSDFEFRNEYDAMWHQLGRRLDLPGYSSRNVPFQRLPAADTLALAAGFVVQTPVSFNSTTEGLLDVSLSARDNQPFPFPTTRVPTKDVDITLDWGNVYFADRDPNYRFYSRRPLIVTSNPVSLAAPIHLSSEWTDKWNVIRNVPKHPTNEAPDMLDYYPRYRGRWESNPVVPYTPGDIVRSGDRTYVCVERPITAAAKNIDPFTVHDANKTTAEAAGIYWEYQPYTPAPMKASLNTATFRELYRAFWNVICDERDPDRHPLASPPFYDTETNIDSSGHDWDVDLTADKRPDHLNSWNNYTADHAGQMFRSSIRDHTSGNADIRLNGKNQGLLRAALAAVNAIDLRDSDNDVTSRTIMLEAETSSATRPVRVTVFGNEKQPFITRVYLNSRTAASTNGYCLIELYNPHRTPVDITGWKIVTIKRTVGARSTTSHSLTRAKTFDIQGGQTTDYVIPSGGNVYLATSTSHALDITPGSATILQLKDNGSEPNVRTHVFEHELVLMRPRLASGAITPKSTLHYDEHDEPGNVMDWVPVDQYDASAADRSPPHPPGANGVPGEGAYLYWRDPGHRWKCVYPGSYNGNKSTSPSAINTRYEGVNNFRYNTAPVNTEPQLSQKFVLGVAETGGGDNPFPPIPLNDLDYGGPRKTPTPPGTVTGNMFPFGGFARVGDVLQVPYIGAYKIKVEGTSGPGTGVDELIELNSISMDSALVADRDTTNNPIENLGRFCPPQRPFAAKTDTSTPDWTYYDWAKDIFDHFTVLAPYDDHSPNTPEGPPVRGEIANYPGPEPYPVVTKFLPNTTQEDQSQELAVEGLININTAPWRVLATVPWVAPGEGAIGRNSNIARAIIRHRRLTEDFANNKQPRLNRKGPFRTLMDLQDVLIPQVSPGGVAMPSAPGGGMLTFGQFPKAALTSEPGDDRGDISPEGSGNVDGTRDDFEEQFLMLTRVSNLITTRSDSFTAYICLQQWENAGTPDARMVSQRRYAVLLDRSGIVKDKKDVKVSYIPID